MGELGCSVSAARGSGVGLAINTTLGVFMCLYVFICVYMCLYVFYVFLCDVMRFLVIYQRTLLTGGVY